MTGMRGAVTSDEGTAHAVFSGYAGPSVAGKTGTAQVLGKSDTSLFGAVMPAEDPRYAVVAIVEEAGAGADVAAPIVRRVIQTINETESDTSLPPIGTIRAREPETPTSVVAPPVTGPAPDAPSSPEDTTATLPPPAVTLPLDSVPTVPPTSPPSSVATTVPPATIPETPFAGPDEGSRRGSRGRRR